MRSSRAGALGVALLLTVSSVGAISTTTATGARSVRGFDGSTVTVAGLGIADQFPGGTIGAQARFKRFNDTHELKGINIKYTEFANDKQDPATTLTEARRLVTQTGVFAIVPDLSATNPSGYFAQQHVPYFGWAFDVTYCSSTPTTKLWGFGFYGCIVTKNPIYMNAFGADVYKYVSAKTGKKHPTAADISNDNQSGKATISYNQKPYTRAGFRMVYAKATVADPVSDWSPYVQELMRADHGNPPDLIRCSMGVDCIGLWQGLSAAGYKGEYWSALYSDILVKPLAGTLAGLAFHNLSEQTPGLKQLIADVDAVKPGYAIDSGAVAAYSAADMFIQALETVAKKGKSAITPENVQRAASTMRWELKGVTGPVQYPRSTVVWWPYCQALAKSNGTSWETVEPYTCYTGWNKIR